MESVESSLINRTTITPSLPAPELPFLATLVQAVGEMLKSGVAEDLPGSLGIGERKAELHVMQVRNGQATLVA